MLIRLTPEVLEHTVMALNQVKVVESMRIRVYYWLAPVYSPASLYALELA
jgi:hypothetical protein